ncbi:MAG: methyltransferase domain-containing protein [Gammaproteobacteria bacterium]|jgi:ubiquinone/menaquinone biosynthesis C-methylase UbiE
MKKLPRNLRHLLLLLALALLLAPLAAQEQSVRPGFNRKFDNPDWSYWVAAFENPSREIYNKRYAIVAATGIRPGMDVADIGAGTGLFTRLFASRVAPKGKVYAVDISAPFIKNILRTCREQRLTNVVGIVNTPRDVSLPAESIDLAFITDTYHHFEYPQNMLASIHRALRPNGRMIIIDFRRDPRISTPWVMQHVRAGKDTVIREIEAAGFRLVDERPVLHSNYFLRFRKNDR